MADGAGLPKNWKETREQIVWGVLILGFGLEFCASLLNANYGRALLALVGMGVLALMLMHGEQLRQRLLTVSPNWIYASFALFLAAIIFSPFIEEKRWPLSAWFSSAQPMTSAEDIAKATAPIAAERDALKQRITELKSQLDTAVSALNAARQVAPTAQQTAPQSLPTLTSQDISAKISTWRSIAKQLDALNSGLNEGDALLVWFEGGTKDDKYSVQDFSRAITERRIKLEGLRDSSYSYNDILDALKEASRSAGRTPVPGTIFDRLLRSLDGISAQMSSDSDIKQPYILSFKKDLAAIRDWTVRTKQLAESQAAILAAGKPN